jgi:dipeptidyl aminopeptidase/acylaminoacyl peptidase
VTRVALSVGRAAAGFALCLVALAGAGGAALGAPAPPDWIAYTGELADGRRALHVSRADGSGARQITEGPNDYNARWSPDGRKIAFERSIAEDQTAVWVVNADGSGARELDADPYAEHPRWSPRGGWIAYQVQTSFYIYDGHRANTTFELRLVRPDGSRRRLLVASEPPNENDNPRSYVQLGGWSWSPDDTQIAFTRPRTPDADYPSVNVVDVATGRTRLLLRGGEDPAWSPDGRNLVVTVDAEFTVGQPGCGSIWVVSVARGTRHRLARARGSCGRFPRWSPDGRTIVFERKRIEGGPIGFMAVAPEGTHLRPVIPLRAAVHRWPRDCARLFEYTTPFANGLVVNDERGRARFVALKGDWRCGR